MPVKVIDKPTISTDMSSLVLPTTGSTGISFVEVSAIVSSFSFLKSFAELIVKDPDFDHLNFGTMKNEKSLYGYEIKKSCGGIPGCVVEKLAFSLEGLFTIEKGLTENRFTLTVNVLDAKSIQKIIDVLIKVIELNRVQARQYSVAKEITNIEKLITESHLLIDKIDGFNILEEQGEFENNISDMKEKLRLLQYSISNEAGEVNTLEAQLEENKKSIYSDYAKGTVEYENMVKSKNKLFEIRQNIISLSSVSEEMRSFADKQILSELQNEQKQLAKKLPREGRVKSLESTEAFKDSQFGRSSDFAFDHVVSQKKLLKLQEEFKTTKNLLNEMLQQKLSNESKVNGIKLDVDFLKNLESKLMSLKLLNATMTSDLIFEDFSRQTRDFRNSSYVKILLFSFCIASFLYIISILIRYSLDDTIYGEEEILEQFKSLDFIGEVPVFE